MPDGILIAFAVLVVMGFLIYRAWYYRFRCCHCRRPFRARLLAGVFSRGKGGKRYLRCPHCSQRGWHTMEPPAKCAPPETVDTSMIDTGSHTPSDGSSPLA